MPTPEEIKDRIRLEADEYVGVHVPLKIKDYGAHTKRVHRAYVEASEREALKAQILVEALEKIIERNKGFVILHEDGQIAQQALNTYNQNQP